MNLETQTIPRRTLDLLRRASVFGPRVDLEIFSAFVSREKNQLRKSLEKAGLFTFDPDGRFARFADPAAQKEIYGSIGPQFLRHWHRHLGYLLKQKSGSPADVFDHLLRGEDEIEALSFGLRAARTLLQEGRSGEASPLAEEAKKLAVKLALKRESFEAEEILFEISARSERLDLLLARLRRWETETAGEQDFRIRLAVLKGKILLDHGRFEESRRALWEAAELSGGRPTPEILALLGRVTAKLGKNTDVVRQAIEQLHRSGTDPALEGDFWSLLGYVAYVDFQIPPAEDFFKKSLAAYTRTSNFSGIQKAWRNLGHVAYAQGNFEAARERYLQSCHAARDTRDDCEYAEALMRLGDLDFSLLKFREALRHLRRAARILRSRDRKHLRRQAELSLGCALYFLGDLKKAVPLVERARSYFLRQKLSYEHAQAIRMKALILLELGRGEEALEAFDGGLRELPGQKNQEALLRVTRLELLEGLHRYDAAREGLRAFERELPEKGLPEVVRLNTLRLAWLLEEERTADRLEKDLQQAKSGMLVVSRLRLLLAMKAKTEDPEVRKEVTALADRIRAALPEKHRAGFERKWGGAIDA